MNNVIGRYCMVRDIKHGGAIVEGTVIDCLTNGRAKRIRLQTGEYAGDVLMLGEYEFLEFIEVGEAPATFADACANALE